MNVIASASAPAASATVMASAGTGKTWLLVTRVVRLLLDGAAPDAILAVTFTRKAAAEMAARLTQRLAELARLDDHGRRAALATMGITPTAELLRNAADLYERQLRHTRQVRFTTFHAFCQDLLRRFPLEAHVPAGFEVLDSPGLLEQQAWDALVNEATAAPDAPAGQALGLLFDQCNGLHQARAVLRQFINYRSDWWAYAFEQTASVEWALRRLAAALEIDSAADPLADTLSPRAHEELREVAALLDRHGTATSITQA
ncbi:MAG: UvrD-helicase domain-containing protein, partial [Pseudomonadota bacterium]